MAATVAAIAGIALQAGGQAYGASQQGKAKNKTVQRATPSQQAIQNIVARLLLGSYGQGPQTFGNYRDEGPRQPAQTAFTPTEATALGMIPKQALSWMTVGGKIIPQYFDPATIQAIQQSFTPAALTERATNPNAPRPPWTGEWGGYGNQFFIRGDPGEQIHDLQSGKQKQIMQDWISGMTPGEIQRKWGVRTDWLTDTLLGVGLTEAFVPGSSLVTAAMPEGTNMLGEVGQGITGSGSRNPNARGVGVTQPQMTPFDFLHAGQRRGRY